MSLLAISQGSWSVCVMLNFSLRINYGNYDLVMSLLAISQGSWSVCVMLNFSLRINYGNYDLVWDFQVNSRPVAVWLILLHLVHFGFMLAASLYAVFFKLKTSLGFSLLGVVALCYNLFLISGVVSSVKIIEWIWFNDLVAIVATWRSDSC
jgi:hypothetical protein